ncbi:MAG: DUF2779 domain-containing protein [Candidatus Margulisiibacteriota bacterium]
MNSNANLSKSKYLRGLQCPKLLWYEYNRKSDIPKPEPAVQFAFDEGKRVGQQSQRLFPDGIVVARDWVPQKQAEKSLAALKKRKPLFEAGFVYSQAYALADILVPVDNDSWDLIEVKSSTSAKEEHYHDVAFQRYVYQGAGVKIRKCYLMYINKEYVRQGEIDPKQLFEQKDITMECAVLESKIAKEVAAMLKVISAKDIPDIPIGQHCKSPRDCPLIDVCWSFLPDQENVFILYSGGRKSFDLLSRGISKITDIPDDFNLNYRQVIQVQAHRSGKPYVDKEAIREFLGRLEYPIYYLDFETVAPAIPLFDQARPYQSIPFQYSLFVITKEGSQPIHHTFLAPDAADPRPSVLAQLKELLGDQGSIVSYSAGFEKSCLKSCANAYPDHLDWVKEVNKRFVDLLEPFQKFNVYHPAQAGRASLKNVLPAMTKSSYQNLKIAEGGAASAEFYRVTYGEDISKKDREEVREALKKYCDIDTIGMVEVIAALKALL